MFIVESAELCCFDNVGGCNDKGTTTVDKRENEAGKECVYPVHTASFERKVDNLNVWLYSDVSCPLNSTILIPGMMLYCGGQ